MNDAEFIEAAKRGERAKVEKALALNPFHAVAKEDGVSVILWAVYYGHAPIARLIADARLNSVAPAKDGNHGSPGPSDAETTNTLDSSRAGGLTQNRGIDIFEAAALGDQHIMEQLIIQDPESINDYSADGYTPLGLAAYFGHLEMVKQLLKAGANPNLPSKNALGVIPLHSALSNGAKEIARALVEAGSDVNFPNKEGWTPLHYTAHSGDWETSDFLLSKGASTSQVNNIGETAAMEARTHGYTDLADILE